MTTGMSWHCSTVRSSNRQVVNSSLQHGMSLDFSLQHLPQHATGMSLSYPHRPLAFRMQAASSKFSSTLTSLLHQDSKRRGSNIIQSRAGTCKERAFILSAMPRRARPNMRATEVPGFTGGGCSLPKSLQAFEHAAVLI